MTDMAIGNDLDVLRLAGGAFHWESDTTEVDGVLRSGLLRWPLGQKLLAELSLDVDDGESVYSVVLRFDAAVSCFRGEWTLRDGSSGKALCQIYQEAIEDDIELEGSWYENGEVMTWTGRVQR